MKKRIWSSDWFAGLTIAVVIMLFSGSTSFQNVERSAYDWGIRSTHKLPSDQIAIIAIDDESIANIGRWPWPRHLHATVIEKLQQSGAKVIGQTIFFLEPQIDPGSAHISDLADLVHNTSFAQASAEIDQLDRLLQLESKQTKQTKTLRFYQQSSVHSNLREDIKTLQSRLANAEQSLDNDVKLAESIQKAGNVVLAMILNPGRVRGKPEEPPDYILKNALTQINDRISAENQGLLPIATNAVLAPIAPVGVHASAIGHLNAIPDIDGSIRSEPLVMQHQEHFYPSLSLQIAAQSLNLDNEDIKINLAESVELGNLQIKTDTLLQMNTFFYSGPQGLPVFSEDSFYDVYTGKIDGSKYRDKIVLIGATAVGVGNAQVTPINATMPPVHSLAHSLSSILNEDFIIAPEWGFIAHLIVFLLIALYLMFAMPKMKAGIAAAITFGLLISIIAAHYIMMTQNNLWVPLMTPAILLVLGHLLITTKRFLVTERGKTRSDEESSESNRMLGIAFQSQGQLDMAFEKFRKCSPDRQVMEAMYNLALDFERKRQFNKATAVYRYITQYDKGFRDIEARMARSLAMEETIMLGGSGGHAGGTLLLNNGIEKPMLGRYEIEKELGKGAMGVVYLGKDPKIGRVVAIKTMALAKEFAEDELENVKERFFREAETAGRLSHPYIVTIYDAGEEHDLAYIAMEFLAGHDLDRYVKVDHLLEVRLVASIVHRAAEGLAFAHQQNVVHRDIKPANIMYEPTTDTLKITDFGIARITDSSKTKTGMVLGTPSYMSPEQLAGEKIDGRSDIFSLGVMLFQLLSGSLPIQADSLTSLMFKITNEEAPDIQTIRPDIPNALSAIISKALTKNIAERYQTGTAMATDLKHFLDHSNA